MAQSAGQFSIRVEQVDGFDFRVRFDKEQFRPLDLDEPPPLGHDHAPNAARVLAAAVGNCLSASLVFCLQKRGVRLEKLSADVTVELVRNENRRLRIGHVDVQLHPSLEKSDLLDECIRTFEDFCIVTQSVRAGLDVRVTVTPSAG
jgi:organic hydroperoxide reductase OsmC/OhrA